MSKVERPFQRGMRGYATILRLLMDEPCTAARVGERIGNAGSMPRALLRAMHDHRLIHVWHWQADATGNLAAVWRAGNGVDAPPPAGKKPKRRALSVRIEMVAFAKVMQVLVEPTTARELNEEVGLYENTTYQLLIHMRSLRLVRIAEWDITGPIPVARYQHGHKRDAVRPSPPPRRERWARENERRSQLASNRHLIHLTARPRGELAVAL